MEVDVVDENYETFHNVYLNVLNKHAPIKKKVIRVTKHLISQRHIGKQSSKDLN